jgi:hypothetical protein
VTGVYFGPEPAALRVDQERMLITQVMKFVYEGNAIKQKFGANNDLRTQSREESEWVMRVENWLRTNSNEATTLKFHNSKDLAARNKLLTDFLQGLNLAHRK